MTKGPFGSDIKKSLYVPKSADTYKVYIQVNAIEKDASLGEYFISKEYFESKMSRFEVKPNDYIITCDGTLGRYLRLPPTIERGIISASLLRITLKTNILPRFFEYLWDGYIMSRLTSDIRNSALVHLPSATKIGKVLIPLPSLAEQERIVAELDLLQGIIDKQKAQLKELDTLAQSIFYDMFGDPVENEKGWIICKLEENCEVSSAKRVLVEDVVDSGIPFIRGTELTALNKATSSKEVQFSMFITLEHYNKLKAITGVPVMGDILIPSINSEGITWVVDTDEPFYFKDGRVIWVHVNKAVFTSEYLKTAISHILRSNYDNLTSGATFLELKLFIVRDLLVPIPPFELQQAFGQRIQAIRKQKASINASIAETQKLFDYKMDKYFG